MLIMTSSSITPSFVWYKPSPPLIVLSFLYFVQYDLLIRYCFSELQITIRWTELLFLVVNSRDITRTVRHAISIHLPVLDTRRTDRIYHSSGYPEGYFTLVLDSGGLFLASGYLEDDKGLFHHLVSRMTTDLRVIEDYG